MSWQSKPMPVTPEDERRAQVTFTYLDSGDGVHETDFRGWLTDINGFDIAHTRTVVGHLVTNGHIVRDDHYTYHRPEGYQLEPPLNRKERAQLRIWKFLGRIGSK